MTAKVFYMVIYDAQGSLQGAWGGPYFVSAHSSLDDARAFVQEQNKSRKYTVDFAIEVGRIEEEDGDQSTGPRYVALPNAEQPSTTQSMAQRHMHEFRYALQIALTDVLF